MHARSYCLFYRIYQIFPCFMSSNQINKIYPCPFSKGYGIPIDQAWSLLKIFFIYRFIISSLFVILFYGNFDSSLLDTHDAWLSFYSSHSYLAFTALTGICAYKKYPSYTTQTQLILFSDIIFITLLMHATSGGINSGIGILLAISIASGGLLIGGYCALLFAALASLAIMAEQIHVYQSHASSNTAFAYAGMLGISFFTIAYLSYVLAKRTEQSDILATQQQQTILNLEELNQYIIQHLQSGIVISNSEQQIKMCNEATLNICKSNEDASQLHHLLQLSPRLAESFQLWLDDKNQNFAIIRLPNQSEIHVRFSLVKTRLETFHMIILEDIALYNQRLQQSKLASLGCLTASIAHEIRNPLGAISHAGQLLSEAPELSTQDQRLTEIIQSHCRRVNKIIEDVLQLSRREPSNKEKIELAPWINSYLKSYIQTSGCDPNVFQISIKNEDLWTQMDQGHLKQILDNLCSNALKYGDVSTDKIMIEISLSENAPCIRILDNGVGIDAETASHLFEPFFTTSPTGTGLGLYISKELAELNQAILSYEKSSVNYKSCFKLNLPNEDASVIEI